MALVLLWICSCRLYQATIICSCVIITLPLITVYNHNLSPLSEDAVGYVNQKLKSKYREMCYEWRQKKSREFEVNTRIVRLKDSASKALKRIDYSTRLETVEEFEDELEIISPNEVINLILPGTFVSVSGPRGIGKSAFIRRICHCWATGYKLRKFKLLLCIDLCTSPSKPYNNCTELLSASLASHDLSRTFNFGVHTLVILDHYHDRWVKMLAELIEKEITVVVISWKPVRFKHIERISFHLLGLTDEQISRQVLHYYQNSHSRAEHFLQYLSSVPNYSYLKRVPVYLFGLLAVFDHTSAGHPPQTLTSFLSCLAMMMVNVDDSKLNVLVSERIYDILEELPTSSQSLFHKICQKVYSFVDTHQKQSVRFRMDFCSSMKSLVPKHELGDLANINPLLMEPLSVPLPLQPGQWLQLTAFPLLNDFLASLNLSRLQQPSLTTVNFLKFNRELIYFSLDLMPLLRDELKIQTSYCDRSLSYCYDDGVDVDCCDTRFYGLLTSKDMRFLRTLAEVQLNTSCHYSRNGLVLLLSCSATCDVYAPELKHLR